MQTRETFITPDINAAAVIVALLGKEPECLDRSDSDRVRFIFRRVEGLDDLLEAYWRRELKVDPISFAMAQKFLKNQLYNRR